MSRSELGQRMVNSVIYVVVIGFCLVVSYVIWMMISDIWASGGVVLWTAVVCGILAAIAITGTMLIWTDERKPS